MPTLKRNPSAHALNVHEQFFLIDCGEGTQTRLFRCGISPLRLGTVFLTHLHGDHVYGLFGPYFWVFCLRSACWAGARR